MSATSCAALRALLSAYLDGETSPGEARRVEEHVRGCEECRAVLDDYVFIGQALQDLERPRPPASLYHAVRERAEARPRVSFPLGRLAPLAAMAAAIVALYVGAFALLRGAHQPEPAVAVERPVFRRAAAAHEEAISLHFNRPMDPESVVQNLRLAPTPPGPVSYTWSEDRQTLTIEPRTQLASDTTYVVTIGRQARDNQGHALDRPLVGEVKVAMEVPSPGPNPNQIQLAQSLPTPSTGPATSPTRTGSATPPPAVTPSPAASLAVPSGSPTVTRPEPTRSPAQSTVVGSVGTVVAAGPPPAVASITVVPVAPGSTPAARAPTAIAAAPGPIEKTTPIASGGAPAAAVAVTATAVATASPTPGGPAATPFAQPPEPAIATACPTPLLALFGKLLAPDAAHPVWLGCPTDPGQTVVLGVQRFEQGQVLWRPDRGRFLVLFDSSATWSSYLPAKPDHGAEDNSAVPTAERMALAMRALFAAEPELVTKLGPAPGSATTYQGATQGFERGVAYQSGSGALFLLADRTWRGLDGPGAPAPPAGRALPPTKP